MARWCDDMMITRTIYGASDCSSAPGKIRDRKSSGRLYADGPPISARGVPFHLRWMLFHPGPAPSAHARFFRKHACLTSRIYFREYYFREPPPFLLLDSPSSISPLNFLRYCCPTSSPGCPPLPQGYSGLYPYPVGGTCISLRSCYVLGDFWLIPLAALAAQLMEKAMDDSRHDSRPVTLFLPTDLVDQVDRLAKRELLSRSSYIRRCCSSPSGRRASPSNRSECRREKCAKAMGATTARQDAAGSRSASGRACPRAGRAGRLASGNRDAVERALQRIGDDRILDQADGLAAMAQCGPALAVRPTQTRGQQ
jgi:hypothetical protein